MAHKNALLIWFEILELKILLQELSKLDSSLEHCLRVFHSVGELIIAKLEKVLTIAVFWVMGLLFL